MSAVRNPSGWVLRATGSAAPMVADAAEVRRALALFVDPEHGCELVALKSGIHRILPGSDLDGLCKAVGELPGGSGLYFRFNPIPADLRKSAVNGDVKRRRWVYIDIDPAKPEGFADESATDAEKSAAWELASDVFAFLSGRGWPAPVIVDSGNGCGLFYRCDLPNDAPTRDAYRRTLRMLAEKFTGARGDIDKAVHNANRLAKVPGTWARKGTPSDDRPHRPCRLFDVPGELELLTLEQLVAAAGEAPPDPVPVAVSVAAATTGDRIAAYGRAALEGVLNDVAGAKSGDRNNALYRGSARLGELAAAGVVPKAEAEAALVSVGETRDPGRDDVAGTVARGMAKGAEEPRGVPEGKPEPKVVLGAAKANGKPGKPAAQPDPAGYWSVVIDGDVAAEGPPVEFLPRDQVKQESGPARVYEWFTLKGLMAAQFPEPVWVVPGVLSEGLNILAGKPKMGKSMLALNLAMTIAAGGKAMGNIQTTPGDVLYLSLEDRTRRLQSRARKMLKGIGCGASPRLTIAAQWPRQGDGGLELIEWWMNRVERPALVIIDVWGKFRPPGNPKANAYSQDYEHMTPLKNLTDRRACCALALMHCRKGSSEDIVEDVSGTLGIAGAADGIIVLTRSRNDNEAKIFITGRDVADTELALRFDPENLTWANLGEASERINSELQKKIVAYLKSEGAPRFVKDIAIHIHNPREPSKTDVESIRIVVNRLAEKKIIRREGNAYGYPGDGGDTDPTAWGEL